MDCLPYDTACIMQNHYDNQVQEMIIEDKAREVMVILGTFNGRTYILSMFDKEYVIAVISNDRAIPPEMF